MSPNPKIDVLYWTASQVYVHCPYCEETHRHGVALPGRRRSHCWPGGDYEFVLPIDQNSKLVGYEIDKKRARFTNVGLQLDPEVENSDLGEEDANDLSNQFRSTMNISARSKDCGTHLSLYDDSTELETIVISDDDTFEQKRILIAISECVAGRVGVVHRHLNTSPEKELFLTGRFRNGDTTVIMAAMEKSCEMVSLLLQHGADVNTVNYYGRSALMVAALWGRIEIVKVLLEADADKGLLDHKGRLTMNLAQPTRENVKERYSCSELAAVDHVLERDADRRHIVLLLGDSSVKKQHRYTTPLSEGERNKYGFRKDKYEMATTFYGPLHSHVVPNINKTAAVLDRGDQFTRVSATSGWAEDALPPNEKSRPNWIDHVYYNASEVGYTFRVEPRKDQGRPGQFNACHAEKKLIAYFIDRHLFLPRDKERNLALKRSCQKVKDSLSNMRLRRNDCERMHGLDKKKEALELELFSADDQLLEDAYDAQKVQRLKDEINVVGREISNLELNVDVAKMRAQEHALKKLWKSYKMHKELSELSAYEPSINLKRAVILSSNQICTDCEMFKEGVNKHFQLKIEMEWRT